MSLQNLIDQAFEGLIPYVAARPDPFLDAFERRDLTRDDHRFLQLLFDASSRPSVAANLDLRIDRWLGSWSRASDSWGDPNEQGRRQADREARIDASLADLSADELAFFREQCPELPNRSGLAATAALMLHREPQTRFARGIVAFALAYTVAGDHSTPLDDVAWVARLNRTDFIDLLAAVRSEIAPLTAAGSSATARTAAGRALRLLGSREAQEQAESISETPQRQSYISRTPRIDPIDPDVAAPEGIADATTAPDVVVRRAGSISRKRSIMGWPPGGLVWAVGGRSGSQTLSAEADLRLDDGSCRGSTPLLTLRWTPVIDSHLVAFEEP